MFENEVETIGTSSTRTTAPISTSRPILDLALIQMKAETLGRIDAALRRLEIGAYGDCIECARPISSERLSAMPFAVRCTTCEDARERKARVARSQPRHGRPELSLMPSNDGRTIPRLTRDARPTMCDDQNLQHTDDATSSPGARRNGLPSGRTASLGGPAMGRAGCGAAHAPDAKQQTDAAGGGAA